MITRRPWLVVMITGCAAVTPAPINPPPRAQAAAQLTVVESATFRDAMARLEQLLAPCTIEKKREQSATEATRLAGARYDALVKCNADKAEALRIIRGGKP